MLYPLGPLPRPPALPPSALSLFSGGTTCLTLFLFSSGESNVWWSLNL